MINKIKLSLRPILYLSLIISMTLPGELDAGPFTLPWWKFRARVKKLFTGSSEIRVRWNVRHRNYKKKVFNPLYERKD
tara:strand:+ start:445 stop:678 length:234 start_codon:yes stop_codon:yes gene_type:complete